MEKNINKKSLNKIEEIKDLINKKTPLNEIVKLKFARNHKNKNLWIEKFHDNFSEDELKYLESYTKKDGEADDNHLQNLSLDEKVDLMITLLKKQEEFISSIKDKTPNSEELNIPVDYYRLTNVKQQGLRINEKTYKRFIKFAKNNNYPIMTLINYILDDFLNKYDK